MKFVNAENLVLAVNSGSSSLKFGLYEKRNGDEAVLYRGEASGIGRPDGKLKIVDAEGRTVYSDGYSSNSQAGAFESVLEQLKEQGVDSIAAVGHRVVHGGPRLRQHQRITDDVLATLKSAVHFAPLHIPASINLIEKSRELLPDAGQFACFDTAFHATMPETSIHYALPEELYKKGVQRYGFHGLSYESIIHRMQGKLPARAVCAHLGSGASLVALSDGRSVDTSMGLTPTGGIPMSTRVGDLDPGVLLFLMRTEGMDANALETMVNHQGGLGALSGGENDMRQLQAAMENGDKRAALAIHIFAGAVRKFIGAYAAELGGLDLLIFTGGIGEHSEFVRNLICKGIEFLGVDPGRDGAASRILVMTSEEEVQIARHARRLMYGSTS
ncbi:MAG TPA: acetate/propionate family kinase [Acidobacteriaceae bacterium]|nr:acetate/propionate family kinase [Acidobacteriaceae bacterium]